MLPKAPVSFHDLTNALMKAGEAECAAMLEWEKDQKPPRISVLIRLQSRVSSLRSRREKKELRALVKKADRARKAGGL